MCPKGVPARFLTTVTHFWHFSNCKNLLEKRARSIFDDSYTIFSELGRGRWEGGELGRGRWDGGEFGRGRCDGGEFWDHFGIMLGYFKIILG